LCDFFHFCQHRQHGRGLVMDFEQCIDPFKYIFSSGKIEIDLIDFSRFFSRKSIRHREKTEE